MSWQLCCSADDASRLFDQTASIKLAREIPDVLYSQTDAGSSLLRNNTYLIVPKLVDPVS